MKIFRKFKFGANHSGIHMSESSPSLRSKRKMGDQQSTPRNEKCESLMIGTDSIGHPNDVCTNLEKQ